MGWMFSKGLTQNICYKRLKRIRLEHWFKIYCFVDALKWQILKFKFFPFSNFFLHICRFKMKNILIKEQCSILNVLILAQTFIKGRVRRKRSKWDYSFSATRWNDIHTLLYFLGIAPVRRDYTNKALWTK